MSPFSKALPLALLITTVYFQPGCSKIEPKPGKHGEVSEDESVEESSHQALSDHQGGHHAVQEEAPATAEGHALAAKENQHDQAHNQAHNQADGEDHSHHHDSKPKAMEPSDNCNFAKMAHKEDAPPAEKKVAADSGVSADQALTWLKNGNTRFMKGTLRKDGQAQGDRERLVAGQKPHAIVLSCSDSRVPPEALFDQKLGEVFVVRTAGESLDNAAIASIEYAVEHLGSHLLVVMAHESCGAVKAAYGTLDGKDAGSPALNALVHDIHPRIQNFLGKDPSPSFLSESKANAAGVARDLVGRSSIIAHKVEEHLLNIETAVYHLGSGWVEFYQAEPVRGLASSKSPNQDHH